jgi:hypothetical protein
MRAILIALLVAVPLSAQTRKPPARKAAPPAAALKKVVPDVTCPTPLGVGLKTKVSYCEVMAGRDPAGGVLIQIPPHKGPALLSFDLHNLHLYSEEQVKAKRAFSRYTATIGVLTMDNTLVSRAVVQSEFRTAADLVDRVGGGAGGGAKAVAPTGTEPITIPIPEGEEQVSLLGEKLTEEHIEGTPRLLTQAGRPIAAVSNFALEYKPGPPPRKKTR